MVNTLLVACVLLVACAAPTEAPAVPAATPTELAAAPATPAATPVEPTSIAGGEMGPTDIGQDLDAAVEDRVEELLSKMTLAEKVGQMTQVEKNSVKKEDITALFIGSILSGGGGYPTPNTPESWARMVNTFQEYALQTRLGIPLIYGVDAVHGHSNVKGAVVFPHNVGLAAILNMRQEADGFSAFARKAGRIR